MLIHLDELEGVLKKTYPPLHHQSPCLSQCLKQRRRGERGLYNFLLKNEFFGWVNIFCRSATPDLLSDDMAMERERRRWEAEEEEKVEKSSGPTHYQEMRQGGIDWSI